MEYRGFPISPSSGWLTLLCPGHLTLAKDNDENEFTREGHEAHALAYKLLVDAPVPGNELDEEMLASVSVYVKYVKHVCSQALLITKEFEVRCKSQNIKGLGGTIDCLLVYEDDDGELVLHVVDYKHGVGQFVAVHDNPQLMLYLLLAAEKFGIEELPDPEGVRFRATVVQPRAYQNSRDDQQIKHADITYGELIAFRDRFVESLLSVELITGDHCSLCNSRNYCPALLALAKKSKHVDVDNWPIQDWLDIYEARVAIKKVCDSVPRKLCDAMQNGAEVEGYKVVESLGSTTWALDEEDLVKELKSRKVPAKYLYKTTKKLQSPTQVAKAIKENQRLKIDLSDLTCRPPRGLVAAPVSDHRQAVEASDPETVFQDYEEC
jgi:hypothetical protein